MPDTLVWRNKLGYAEEMVNSYLRHPAFSDYPVVGVSWVQAYEYAEWRTDRYQELILENSGRNVGWIPPNYDFKIPQEPLLWKS